MNGWYCLKCQKGIFPKVENRGVEKRPYCPYCNDHVFFVDFDYLTETNIKTKGHVCIPHDELTEEQLERFYSGKLWSDLGLTENYPFSHWVLNLEQLAAIRNRRIS